MNSLYIILNRQAAQQIAAPDEFSAARQALPVSSTVKHTILSLISCQTIFTE